MYKKTYTWANKQKKKNVTTNGYNKYPWSLCSWKILRKYNQSIRVDFEFSFYDMIEWAEEPKCMQFTIRCEESALLSWSNHSYRILGYNVM